MCDCVFSDLINMSEFVLEASYFLQKKKMLLLSILRLFECFLNKLQDSFFFTKVSATGFMCGDESTGK